VWQLTAEQTAAALDVDPDRGLGSDEAAARLDRYGPNRLQESARVPEWKKFIAQLADPLIYLLLAAVVIALGAWVAEGREGIPFDALVIAAIVVLNAVLGYVQEARAEEAVEALQKMAAVTATVVRDGEEQEIATAEVVPGDILILGEGDSVSADARLIRSANLMVGEASLTGESEPVSKRTEHLEGSVELGDRINMVFNGTAVNRGRGRAIAVATGMDTEMGKIARLLGETEDDPTPLQVEVARIGKALGIAVVVIAAVVMGTILLTSDISSASDLVGVLLVGVSLAVAAVPEGLPAILSVVLALGVQRMAGQNAIVKRLSSVETLGSASVVCSDKTGTLTRSEMMIERIVTPSGEISVSGSGYTPEGELRYNGKQLDDETLRNEVVWVLVGGSLASDAQLVQHDGHWAIQGDPTEGAFLVAEAKMDLTGERRRRFERVAEIPFTSERKLMSTLETDHERDGRIDVVTKGAPDVLLGRCTHERMAGEVLPLTEARRDEIHATAERLGDMALRTLGVAYRALEDHQPPDVEDDRIESELVYLGMVGIIDPPRPEAALAVEEARRAGVRVLMITGDHPRTAVRIASDLGIADGPDSPVVTGVELAHMSEEELARTVGEATVYARVAPEHKLRIVDALQANGNIVAMTGDGVNDAPALKSADIGVAMGLTGTDVTKEAADMILADDNFATIIAAVREGRAILANIRKFLRFLLSSNVGEVLTMFIGVLAAGMIGLEAGGGAAVPLLATQILWINLLTDTGPALAMGVDPPPPHVMEGPPRKLSDRVIDRDMWVGILWVGTIMAVVSLLAFDLTAVGGMLEGSGDVVEGRTMVFTTLVFAQLFNTFNARSDHRSAFYHLFSNPWLWGAIALSTLLQVLVVQVPFLNQAFGTTPLSWTQWLIATALASLVLWADEAKKLVGRL
jgi:P-type Ca2+ transporter type 2C